MNKVITIIIPTYNMEKYLRRCLDSLLVSTEVRSYLEVLVINDGSKDTSPSIAHEYESNYPECIRVIDKENGNYGSCVNRGLKEAQGRYVKVVDADDYVITRNFESFVRNLSDVDSDLIVSDFDVVTIEGKVDKKWSYNLPQKKVSRIIDYCNSFDFKNMQMHAVAYKKSLLLDMDYKQTEGISFTDQEWMLYPMTKVETFFYIPVVVYQYVIGREGQTVADTNLPRVLDQHLIILYRALSYINNKSLDNNLYEFVKYRLMFLFTFFYRRLLLLKDYGKINEIENQIKNINYRFYEDMNDTRLDRFLPFKFIKALRNGNTLSLSIALSCFKVLSKIK